MVSAFDDGSWAHYPEAESVLGFGPEGVAWATGRKGLYAISP